MATLLSVYYAHMVEYRAEIILWLLSGSFPIILMGVWQQAAQSGQFGLSATDFTHYFLAVFLVRQFTVVWVIWDVEREVLEGQLSFRLLQPLDPVWHYFTGHIAERLTRLPFLVVLVVFFFWLYPEAFWFPGWGRIALSVAACAIAFCLRFLMQYTFAMLAFWTERAVAIEKFSLLFYIFLSGLVAPLEVFPPLARNIAFWTPFPYLMNFPAALLVGFDPQILRGFLMMLGWGAIFFWVNRWLWRRGLKQYSGMGS